MWFSYRRKLSHGLVCAKKVSFPALVNALQLIWSFFRSRLLKRPLISGFPWAISIEPSGLCNLQCPECPVGAGVLTRKGGMMNLQLFRKIVSDSGRQLAHINLFFQGEPMLNNHIARMISYAQANGIYTSMSTNGHHLNETRCMELIGAGLTRIIISLDGITCESYSTYRKGGNLNKVQNSIRTIVATRKKLGSITPFVTVQFLVFKHNEHEIPELIEWCRSEGVDKLELKTAQFNEFGQGLVQPPTNSAYSRYMLQPDGSLTIKGTMRNHCSRQWGTTVVAWDGRVAPCCYDKDLEFSPGDASKESIKAIWRNRNMDQFRHKVLNNRASIEMCRNCTEGRNILF